MITAIQTAPQAIQVQAILAGAMAMTADPYDAPDDPHKDWAGCEAVSFVPNSRQQVLMDAVAIAIDSGLFYTTDVVANVGQTLQVTPEVMAKNTARVEHGNFGYDVYFARKALEAQRRQAERVDVKEQLKLRVGEQLGVIMFSDCKRVNASLVEALSEDGMSITVIGKRGKSTVRGTLCPLQLKSVIERSHEHGARKGGYAAFIDAKKGGANVCSTKAKARPSMAPLTEAQVAQLRADADDVRGAAARKGLALDRWDEAREKTAARDLFDLGTWLYYYSTRVGRRDGLEARIDCLRRLFEAGIYQPGYQFHTIFDFSERHFDTCVEMGDADLVLDRLREIAHQDKNPNVIAAFAYMGWSLESMQKSLF